MEEEIKVPKRNYFEMDTTFYRSICNYISSTAKFFKGVSKLLVYIHARKRERERERERDLPLRFSSGRTYFETGPRESSFSMLSLMSSTYSCSFFITSFTLKQSIRKLEFKIHKLALLIPFKKIT
jgi:hypothetical protein